jgi:serine/threonine protein kinase/WD40 repeat protein
VSTEKPSLDSIFCAAVEIASAEGRAAYIGQACGDDSDLRGRVEKLVAAHFHAGSFLERPAAEDLARGQTGGDTQADSTAPEDLHFLQPSDLPDSLGRLGHFEILEVIGHGGMGVVLRAFDDKLHRVVAIKVMAPELAATSPPRKRFLREARAAAAIRHECVVDIHAVEEQPIPYLVMEYVAGETLQQKLDRIGPLEVPEVLRLGQQIARGLAAAHEKGLIHRDIKPSNILLEKGAEERVKITDFGLARAVADASLTQSGVIAGTPMYMAPEQTVGDSIDHRADLFSFGSVLYTMASGRPPFRATTSMATLKRVAEDAPRPIRDIIPEVPEWLCDIIAKLHAKKPDERFQSAWEVADLLRQYSAHLENPALVPMPAPVAPVAPFGTGVARPESSKGVEDSTPVGTSAPFEDSGRATRKDSGRATRRRRWTIAAAVFLCLLGGLSLTEATGFTNLRATVIRIFTPDGTLVVETDDPGVKVTIEGDGGLVITGAGAQEVRLKPGSYRVQAEKNGHPVPLDQELVTIARGGKQVVKVHLERPAPTIGEVRRIHWKGRYLYFTTFSPDSRYYLATGNAEEGRDLTLRVWEVATGKQVLECVGNECAAFTPDSKQVLVAGPDKALHLWDIETSKELRTFEGHTNWISGVDVSRDGKRALSTSTDATVRIWDVESGKELDQLREQPPGVYARFAPDGKSFLTCTVKQADQTIRLWDTATRKELHSWKHAEPVIWFGIGFEPDGRRFLTVVEGETLTARWWEQDREKPVKELSIAAANLKDLSLGISRDCRRLIYAHQGSAEVVVLNLSDGKQQTRFEVLEAPFGRMDFSPNGRYACGCTMNGRVYLWQLPPTTKPAR